MQTQYYHDQHLFQFNFLVDHIYDQNNPIFFTFFGAPKFCGFIFIPQIFMLNYTLFNLCSIPLYSNRISWSVVASFLTLKKRKDLVSAVRACVNTICAFHSSVYCLCVTTKWLTVVALHACVVFVLSLIADDLHACLLNIGV